jgi:hypothetical protein
MILMLIQLFADTAVDLPNRILHCKFAIKYFTRKPSMEISIDSLTWTILVDYKSESWHIAGVTLLCLAESEFFSMTHCLLKLTN